MKLSGVLILARDPALILNRDKLNQRKDQDYGQE